MFFRRFFPDGVITLFDAGSRFIADVAANIGASSLEITMPLSALGSDDGNVDITVVLGNSPSPTDWAPDAGHGTVGPLVWLTVEPTSGSISGGSSDLLGVTFDAADLAPGSYTSDIIVTTNDPDENPVILPVIFTVEASAGATVADLSVTMTDSPDPVRAGRQRDNGCVGQIPLT